MTLRKADSAKNTVISPKSLLWKFCGKAQFKQSFGRIGEYGFAFEIPKIELPQSFQLIASQGNLEAFHKPKKIYDIIVSLEVI